VTLARAFPPSFDALAELVAFTTAAFEQEGIDRRLQTVVDFALEELFTNVVKYGRSTADIRVELRAIPDGVEGSLTADGVADFDVTRAPALDTHLPLEQRQPGGLGLQLTRQMVDSIEYEYQDTQRRSRVTFRKTLA
jgi:anti-sigma regulatory factor (Ser/Thr protein kinase)